MSDADGTEPDPAVARVALVAGGGGAIGGAIARGLADDGLAVGIVDRDAEGAKRTVEAIETGGGGPTPRRATCPTPMSSVWRWESSSTGSVRPPSSSTLPGSTPVRRWSR